jgi:two-component system, oxyanion-binding sensor
MTERIVAGYIPLVDSAALLIAADFGFAEQQGLAIELVREVSWANMREKLNAGIFDAAHLLAPMAIASSLDLMSGSVPLAAPFVLAANGNAISVSKPLYESILMRLEGRPATPLVTAQALASIIAERKRAGKTPLTFGTTFPFSCHTYQLRFWMAAGGIDTAEDVRIAVLPPPYMADGLKSGEVDSFCAGEPWSSVAMEQGLGQILHFGCEIIGRLTEKVLATRLDWCQRHEEIAIRLIRAVSAAAGFASRPENWEACCERLAAADRIDVSGDLIHRDLSGSLLTGPESGSREDRNFLILGAGQLGRPDPAQAAWLYSQMVRWGQAAMGLEHAARAAFSPVLFDRAFGEPAKPTEVPSLPADGLGAFTGPPFDKDRIADYLASIGE